MKMQPGSLEYWRIMPWPLDKNAPGNGKGWQPMPPDFISQLPFFGQWPPDPHAPPAALHRCVTLLIPGHYEVDCEKWDGARPIPLWMIIPELMSSYRFHELVPVCINFKNYHK